ncbi:type II toxin-antitoxin system RelE/ParE family toxin [Anaerovibrio lipolyticus]|jgi:toxin ParE1/3/4|uniref:type II toxin-antitoxin system RelE/ParE family toxin n=1 Tax=Anaerovibrio lipolyticus TaxID=82374 RepID=UPI0026F2D773|nr:type II toxin-antitoxin system RelE/ParE family toxin [Anaerovibrio lipolyticus]MBE6105542.1 type II toxin-antitoxin system RelE/ParE family toxin [Anaerovibrio lipolyticus]
MKYEVKILPQAWEDLARIMDWYRLSSSKESSLKVADNILKAISRLENFPKSGTMTPDDWLNQRGYRMVIADKHVAIYRFINEAIYVYHIFDMRQDYPEIFRHLEEE